MSREQEKLAKIRRMLSRPRLILLLTFGFLSLFIITLASLDLVFRIVSGNANFNMNPDSLKATVAFVFFSVIAGYCIIRLSSGKDWPRN